MSSSFLHTKKLKYKTYFGLQKLRGHGMFKPCAPEPTLEVVMAFTEMFITMLSQSTSLYMLSCMPI